VTLTFYPNRPGGHTPRPILTQNGSNDVGSRKDVPFGAKSQLFETPDPQTSKPPKFAQFWSGQNVRSISRLALGVSRVNTPYSSSEPNKSVIVNRRCAVGNSNILCPKKGSHQTLGSNFVRS